MRVLFFMRSTVYVRNFESTLRRLAARGHQVHIAAEPHHQPETAELTARLCHDYAGITHGAPPPPLATRWARIGYDIRRSLDYLRYLDPIYDGAAKLRRRAEVKAPAAVTATSAGRWLTATPSRRRLLRALLDAADRAVPRNPAIDVYLREQRPDLVVVTPLVEPGSPQSEYVRAARAAGVRTALCVYSWDNLTNKGLIHDDLDLVTVWNAAMKAEAQQLHAQPAERVVVTGAVPYDHWFGWQPSATREAFCRRVGLDPGRPYLLYLCSSRFIAPDELQFVRRWLAESRAASATLREAGVLIRPHPQNMNPWREADFSGDANVVVWPRGGGNPVDESSRSEYFDSIHHSAAVVGVNTSAQIESAIGGRGVYTLLAPEFHETQEGTLHFRHLREADGGLLHVAVSMAEHVAQLEAALARPEEGAARCGRFVDEFVRPHGRGEAASPRLVRALEDIAARGRRQPAAMPAWAGLVRPVLFRVGAAVARLEAAKNAGSGPSRSKRRAQEARARPESAKAIGARTAARAHAQYLRMRDQFAAQRDAFAVTDLTAAEQQRLADLDWIWDAGTDAIANLRSTSKAISGVRPTNYRAGRADAVRQRLERDLERLLDKGDPALWVGESPALGGFGVSGLRPLYNEDTLRYFRVMSLLQDASVLTGFRRGVRRTVWEAGGGWGGLAYQFKRLVPDATYLMTGAPAQLLVAAVYLTTHFPQARVRVFDPASPEAFWCNWEGVDFAFAPESTAGMRMPPVELMLDVDALRLMTARRAAAQVRQAYDAGARHLLSIAADNGGAAVHAEIERFYWRHPVSAPAYLDRRLAVREPERWLLGWRRMTV